MLRTINLIRLKLFWKSSLRKSFWWCMSTRRLSFQVVFFILFFLQIDFSFISENWKLPQFRQLIHHSISLWVLNPFLFVHIELRSCLIQIVFHFIWQFSFFFFIYFLRIANKYCTFIYLFISLDKVGELWWLRC